MIVSYFALFKFNLFLCLNAVLATKVNKDSFRGQYCTDPRTMKQHEAYTEWADAYSCTRHRCQPGGRNLAIYTVGCKRVEAPESAIECEEVVEDTNMQFPYCCTRLRCLVVVRGEVWTRVLGQPWEKLPAAPWSHMYKMKKPPPTKTSVASVDTKNTEQGPVYELADIGDKDYQREKGTRKTTSRIEQRAIDTDNVKDPNNAGDRSVSKSQIQPRSPEKAKFKKSPRKQQPREPQDELEEESVPENNNLFMPSYSPPISPPAAAELSSQETFVPSNYPVVTQKKRGNFKTFIKATEAADIDKKRSDEPISEEKSSAKMQLFHAAPDFTADDGEGKKEEKSANLQSLVDAIGTRMRDIESVVQKMSKKVEKKKEVIDTESAENKFTSKDRKTKYVRSTNDLMTTEASLYLGENFNGYFDSSNAILKRNYAAKDARGPPTYMAPITDRRAKHPAIDLINSEEERNKHKSMLHRKKHLKTIKKIKKHHKPIKVEKRKRFNKMNSMDVETPIRSSEDNL